MNDLVQQMYAKEDEMAYTPSSSSSEESVRPGEKKKHTLKSIKKAGFITFGKKQLSSQEMASRRLEKRNASLEQ